RHQATRLGRARAAGGARNLASRARRAPLRDTLAPPYGSREAGAVNYFVTGATGFIGRHLVELLLRRDGTVYALVREGSRGRLDELGERLGAGDRLVPVPGDLSQEGLGVEGFSEKIDHFFHLAAIYDMTADDESMRKANVDGTRHVVEFANSIDVGTFHHTSSIA